MSATLILAEDVRDRDGRLLLPRGTPVDKSQLDALSCRGATAVLVMEATTAEASEPALVRDADAIGRRLDRLFRACGDDDATTTLREYVLRYRLGSSR